MADATVKRVILIAAAAGAVVGGAVAGGVAAASANGGGGGGTSTSSSTGSVSTAAVVRTNLQTTVQVGGSIGYQGSYVVIAPTGASPQQVTQAKQSVTQAQEGLANDETNNSYTATQDDNVVTSAQNAVNTAAAALVAGKAAEAGACAGRGRSTPTCGQDTQKMSQEQSAYDQAQQQLSSATFNRTRDQHQAQVKLQSDNEQLQSAEANLATVESTAANGPSTYTTLPSVGDIIREDQAVYRGNGLSVPLLYGPITAYRAFWVGMADGADVGELTHDLIALGYGAGLSQSDHYSTATATAVERWQTALGLPVTGTVLLGQVVFEPGPIRVTSVTPSVGQPVGGGSILDATSVTPTVTVDLNVTQEYLLKPGDPVTVELPDGVTTVGGVVQSVGNVAVCPGGNGNGTGNATGNNSADQTPCSSSGSGSSSTPTVTVIITLDRTPPGATLDQAPVNVNITTQRADNVLAVPVNALLALQGGGYAVQVVSGNTQRLVGVTTGLYSNTMVQVSGAGITAGTRVEVPSS